MPNKVYCTSKGELDCAYAAVVQLNTTISVNISDRSVTTQRLVRNRSKIANLSKSPFHWSCWEIGSVLKEPDSQRLLSGRLFFCRVLYRMQEMLVSAKWHIFIWSTVYSIGPGEGRQG